MKILVNEYERITHDRLETVCSAGGAHVCPKVRVKDALPVENSGVSAEQYRFSLQSHFDFLVTDKDWNTLFAVEFDGPSHCSPSGKDKDEIKDGLCERFSLPLLRVNANHLHRKFRQWDLLSYFVEIWFLKRAFDEAQVSGCISIEEDFDPMCFISDGHGRRWPYWFSAPAQLSIKKLQESGRIADGVPSHLIGCDAKDNIHCLAFLKLADDQWAVKRTGMRSQLFDVCNSDVMWQVGIVELHESLEGILAGHEASRRFKEVNDLIQQFHRKYQLLSSGGSGEFRIKVF